MKDNFPKVHFGTYKLADENCHDAVLQACLVGYAAVDTATAYRNEAIVSKAIVESGEPIYLTTKIAPAETGYENCLAAFESSLTRLQRDSVDLLLLHWPGKSQLLPDSNLHRPSRIQTWRDFETIYKQRKAKAIGVSNFTIAHIEQLVEDGAAIMPMVNQVELHVCLMQKPLKQYCSNKGIILQSYSPLGGGGSPVLQIISKAIQDNRKLIPESSALINKEPFEIALRAALKLSDSVVVKSGQRLRISENLSALTDQTWDLSDYDMEFLSRLDTGTHFCWNPETIA